MYSQEIGKFDANKKFQSIVKNCLFLLLVLIYQDSRIQVKIIDNNLIFKPFNVCIFESSFFFIV